MDIVNLISNVGVPVAICVWSMYYIRELNKEAREERKELLEQAADERDKTINTLTAKIDSLTNLVCALTDMSVEGRKVIDYED